MLRIKTGTQPLEEVLDNFAQGNLDLDPNLTSIINKWKELLDNLPFKFTVHPELWAFNKSAFVTLQQTWENERTIYSLGSVQDIKLESPFDPENIEDEVPVEISVTIPSVIETLTNWYNELVTHLSIINAVLNNPNKDVFDQFNLKPENIIIRETKLFSVPSDPNNIVFLFGYFDHETNKEVFVEVPLFPIAQVQEWSHLFGVVPNEVARYKIPHTKEIFKEVKDMLNETNNVASKKINFDPIAKNNTVELTSGSYWYWFMLNQEQ